MDIQTSYRRSVARAFIVDALEDRGEGTSAEYDVEAIVTELVNGDDHDYETMSGMDFHDLISRHEALAEPTDEEMFA